MRLVILWGRGSLIIAEVSSRIANLQRLVNAICQIGFKYVKAVLYGQAKTIQ